MKFTFADDRVLAVVAHPDDAELLCAGTLARAHEDGAAIGICVLCQGDKGQPTPPLDDLVEIRRGEMTASSALLGAELLWGGFPDGELFDGWEARKTLIEVFRQFRPSLVLAHSPLDYHPDHQAASALAAAVSWFCASTGQSSISPVLPEPPALWWMDTIEMVGFQPHFYFDISSHVELKCQMMACHRSQLARGQNSDFSPLKELMLRQCQARGAQSGVRAAEAFQTHSTWKRARAY